MKGAVKFFEQIRAFFAQNVVHGQRADQFARAARFRCAQAKQSEQIDRQHVGVEIHAHVRLVGARVRIADAAALIAHMSQQMTARVLRYRHTQMHAEPPVDQFAVGIAVARAREAAHQHETTAVLDFVANIGEQRGHRRQRKRGRGERNFEPRALDQHQRRIDLGDLRFIQSINPAGLFLNLRTDPCSTLIKLTVKLCHCSPPIIPAGCPRP